MNNGMTGEQIETSVFYGPAFYQRLKHMVAKINNIVEVMVLWLF